MIDKKIPRCEIYAISDCGKKRKNNEDIAYCAKSQYGTILAVADGMGGHRKGEVASKMVIDDLSYMFSTLRRKLTIKSASRNMKLVTSQANREINDLANSSASYSNMGTTGTFALLTLDGTYVVSIGDSRLYSYKKGRSLKQITTDQSYVEMLYELGRIEKSQMKDHPQKNLLTNAIGLTSTLNNVEEIIVNSQSYDILLLCTDGLYNMVSDDKIEEVLKMDNLTVEEKSKLLIKMALDNGGNDNVAVVMMEKEDELAGKD